MSDIPSNGHPENGSAPDPFVPRIAPPDGQRAARGQLFSDSVSEPEEHHPPVFEDEAEPELTVAEVPSVEDSYSPPLGIDPEPESYTEPVTLTKESDLTRDTELGLLEHLAELRTRLLYCFLILLGGTVITWSYAQKLQSWFVIPIKAALGDHGKIVIFDPTAAFTITVQFALISGLILTAPLLLWQIWMFIEPALTKSERRYSLVILPFSTVLFAMGAALAYAVAPLFFKFFLGFQPDGVEATWDYYQSIILLAKMLLCFGVMFQVPVVIIFLNKLGVLSRNLLIEYWRHAVVVIFVVAAVLTPTWDPVTLVACAGPPCVLYALSIWLVKWL
ncbi:twin-arginine translocase subunit TatC [bacterium]|nr:MAG: twin-arginine translocase subunit TatC [bacterium]